MIESLPHDHPLARLFSGTVQHVFCTDVGMADPQIVDYLADMLAQFVHMDNVYPFKNLSGRRLEDLAEMLTEAQLGNVVSAQARDRIIHQHIGDFALFWTGMFPEGLGRERRLGIGDRLTQYTEQGKRSYAIASELTTNPQEKPPAGVLRRLSERFEFCVYGLHQCRKEWDALSRRPCSG